MIRTKMRMKFIAAAFFLTTIQCWAIARPDHPHADLFAEEEIQLGFLVGPNLTGYTSYQSGSSIVSVQSSVRFSGGISTKFIYSFPRFEIDLLWNTRGGINSGETYHSIALPALIKLPIEISFEKDENEHFLSAADLEFGIGYQPDFVFPSTRPHRSLMNGILATAGINIDFRQYILNFEFRYNIGLETIADSINGARPRDAQILLGMFWKF